VTDNARRADIVAVMGATGAGKSSTICAALAAGARGIVPVASVEEASRLAQTLGPGDVILMGERNCQPIEGFPLGNSPLEMTEAAVKGKTLVMTTTNGTRALLATQGLAA